MDKDGRFTVPLAVMLIMPSSVFGLGSKGHQIVALIAEAHLNASTRDKIKATFPKNDALANAAIWPDEVRKALPQMNTQRPRNRSGSRFLPTFWLEPTK